MGSRNRKIILILDQCTIHERQETLQNVQLVFLPANRITHLQLLDAGVIRNPKRYFKGPPVHRLLTKTDCKNGDLRILVDAIRFIAMAWDRVTPVTVANFFSKCIFLKNLTEVPPEPEDPETEGWYELDAGCSMHDFITADCNLATCGACTVEDFLNKATSEASNSSDDEGGENRGGNDEQPSPAAVTPHALNILGRAMATDEFSNDTCTGFNEFEKVWWAI